VIAWTQLEILILSARGAVRARATSRRCSSTSSRAPADAGSDNIRWIITRLSDLSR
jgi:hypothetical protein